ncbi:MAG: hypothetical protein BWY93_00612 [Euryarchaeota archaeon ADurb.BinA087]|nr:MAG: hypothetical protein BWY93_00612 [Euryarchaeota archaeon ADurb.BinA087]HNQ26267.1 DUF86 domain-containing protein [Methanoregulaceae archaeon]HQA81602.1 DUF86 domain-containing protein [Methanoregulaceae archaeon]
MREQERNIIMFLHDILDTIDRIDQFVAGMDYTDFHHDEKTRFATIQCIEIIGEAAKHIPPQFRSHYPDIPWVDIAGMRDKLIHAYFSIDSLKVWKVIKEDIPELKPKIAAILEEWE